MKGRSVKTEVSVARRYAIAIMAIVVAHALTRALWPWVAPHPTPLFLAAIILCALYAGPGPSLLATVMAALVIDYFFISPTGGIEMSVDNAVRTGVFLSVALLVSWINEVRRRAEGELRRHAMQQAAVAELGQRALSGTDLSALMNVAVSVLARRLCVESAVVWELRPDCGVLTVRASVGWMADSLRVAALDPGSDSTLSRALHSTEPIIIHSVADLWTVGRPRLRSEASGCVFAAIPGRGEPFGVLSVYTDEPRVFTDEDIHFVQSIANVLSSAVERARGEEERSSLLLREQEARREAENASSAKDEFLATVSHELRTPLGVIIGWAKMLRDGEVDQRTSAEALERIVRNADLQKRLIEDLIDVSRIVAGKLRVDARPTGLVPVVEDAIEVVILAAKSKGIRIRAEYVHATGLVLGDPDRLRQVVWNLLSNAVKFTPEGGRVEVWLEQAGASAQITVSDNGQGISAGLLPRVFERFRQGESGGGGRSKGIGLGLSIVRHIVEAHGGSVTAESPGEGLGSTFRVRLPLNLPETHGAQPKTTEADRGSLKSEETDMALPAVGGSTHVS